MARPKWDIDETIRGSTQLGHLVAQHRGELESRLAAGTIEGLDADTDVLRGKQRGVKDARSDKKASTESQQQKLAEAADIISTFRQSVRSHYPTNPEVRQAFGVGERLDPRSMDSVTSAIEMFVTEATEHAEVARVAAILPSDVELLAETLSELNGGDEVQEGKKVGSRKATQERNAAHLRVEDTMTRIVAVARIVFRKQPDILEQFEATLPTTRGSRKHAKKAEKPAPQPA